MLRRDSQKKIRAANLRREHCVPLQVPPCQICVGVRPAISTIFQGLAIRPRAGHRVCGTSVRSLGGRNGTTQKNSRAFAVETAEACGGPPHVALLGTARSHRQFTSHCTCRGVNFLEVPFAAIKVSTETGHRALQWLGTSLTSSDIVVRRSSHAPDFLRPGKAKRANNGDPKKLLDGNGHH